MGHIVWWLFLAAVGILLIVYSSSIGKMFGRRERAERNIGGTMTGCILIGFVIIVVGLLFLFGGGLLHGDPTTLKLQSSNGPLW